MVALTKMATAVHLKTESRQKPTHIVELDGLRGIAALTVFFHHLAFANIDPAQWSAAIVSLYRVSRYGSYGVELFFVLSGYLITSLLLQDRKSPSYWHDFYWKRALRILPLYFVSLIGVWIWIPGTRGGVILSAFFLANFAHLFHVDIGGPYWTLAIEEQFYLIWPQFVRRMSVERLQKLALTIIVAEPVLRLIATAFHHHDFLFTFFHCDGLAYGALLACQCRRKMSAEQKTHRNSWRKSPAWWIFAGALFLVVGTARMTFSSHFSLQGEALLLSAMNLWFYSLVRISVQSSGSKYLAILRSPMLVFFGQISYAMYMSHTYVVRVYEDWMGRLQPGNSFSFAMRFAVVLAATIVVSLISRYALELPFMSLRKYVLNKPRQVGVSAVCS